MTCNSKKQTNELVEQFKIDKKTKRRRYRYNKKANIGADIVLVIVLLFVLSIGGIIGYMLLSNFNDAIQSDFSDNTSKAMHQDWTDRYPAWLDGLFITVLVLIWIGVIIGSLFIDTQPIFFIIGIFVLIFMFYIAAHISNMFVEFAGSEGISAYQSAFPIMNYIMNHLLVVIIVIAFSILIALYGKFK